MFKGKLGFMLLAIVFAVAAFVLFQVLAYR